LSSFVRRKSVFWVFCNEIFRTIITGTTIRMIPGIVSKTIPATLKQCRICLATGRVSETRWSNRVLLSRPVLPLLYKQTRGAVSIHMIPQVQAEQILSAMLLYWGSECKWTFKFSNYQSVFRKQQSLTLKIG